MARRREASEVRRTEILEAAVRVIVERGWCATRVTDVAERAGASPALVIHYFETRDRLLAEALTYREEHYYVWAAHELASGGDAKEQLVRLVMATCGLGDLEGQLDAWVLWTEVWARSLRDSGAAAQRHHLDRRWRETLAATVRQGIANGEFDPVDPDEFALCATALMDGLGVQLVLRDPDVSAERMFDLSMKACARELGFAWTEEDRGKALASVPRSSAPDPTKPLDASPVAT